MRQQRNHIQQLHSMAQRLSTAVSQRKSVLNDSYLINQPTNLSINQSFNSPKQQFSTTSSFLIPQPLNSSIRVSTGNGCHSPALRIRTERDEKEDKREKQLMDATLKLLAQNEKLETLVTEQNKIIKNQKDENKALELKLERANQEIAFLKENGDKRLKKLQSDLKYVKGRSQLSQKRFCK